MNPVSGRVSLRGVSTADAIDASIENSDLPFSYTSSFYKSLSEEESSFVSNLEFAEFKSYLYRLLSAQTQRLQACEERILQLEIENSRLRIQQETPLKDASLSKKCTKAVMNVSLELSKPFPLVNVNDDPLKPPVSPPSTSPCNNSARINQKAPEATRPMDAIKPSNGEVHIMGGIDHYKKLNLTVEVLDECSELWMKVCDTPTELHCVHSSAVVLEQHHVFLVNSFPALHGNIKLSFQSGDINDWCTVPRSQSSNPACLGSSASLDSKVCTVGGYHCSTEIAWSSSLVPFPLSCSVLSSSSLVEVYDPYKNMWYTLQSLPDGKIRPSLVSAESHVLYSLGGLIVCENCLCPSNVIERYDTREGIWKRLDTMQHCRAFFGAFGMDYYLVAMGGITTPFHCNTKHSTTATSTVEQYDIRMNRWGPLMPLVEERCGFTCHVLNDDEICILGGQSKLSFNSDTSIKILDRDKYSLNGKNTQSGFLAGMDGYRSGHVSFLLE